MESTLIKHKLLDNVNDLANDAMKEFEINFNSFDENIQEQFTDETFKTKVVKVLLVKQNNQFYCVGSRCSHYGAPLANGVLYKDRVRCFLHGACFNIKTGDIEDFPGVNCIPKFDVIVNSSNEVVLTATLGKLIEVPGLKIKIENLSLSSKDKKKCLIIGSGAAGLVCADKLRERPDLYEVTIITKECHPPYDRPKLSKALNSKISGITLKDDDYFKANSINYFMNQSVESVDFGNRKLTCTSGKNFEYDRLIIAAGVEAVGVEKKAGHHLKGIFTLKTYDDSQNIINFFNDLSTLSDQAKKLNIISYGGSFISTELAAYFADKANVTIVSRGKPFEKIFGPSVSTKIVKFHESKGVKFFTGAQLDIEEFNESKVISGCIGSVKFNDGTTLTADIVLIAIGGRPSTSFLKNTDLKLTRDNYVIVDKNMKTNVENVYAAGDCVYFPRECLSGFDFTLPKYTKKLDHINIAHWGVASLQGKVAAMSILEKEVVFNVVPFFWTVQHNKSVRFAGYIEKYDKIVFHEDKTKQNEFKFAAFYILDERVVGACTLDWDPVCAAFGEIMYNKIAVKQEDIEKDPLDIKKFLA